jgi:uncharacterized protein with HEPN domain
MGNDIRELGEEIASLQNDFKLSTHPFIKFLGMEIIRNKAEIFIHQKNYIEDMLKRFGMSECKTSDVPMLPGL